VKTTRRTLIGAAAAALMVRPLRAAAQDAGKVAPQSRPPDAGSAPAPAPPSEALARLARDRFGKFMDDAQLKLLDERLANAESRSVKLRSFKLNNADEPAVEFRAVRP
jgi:hypothetical protein